MKYGKFFANIYKTSRTNRAVIFKTSFFFKSIKENTNPKLFSESIEATFLREAETCIISLKFANDMNKPDGFTITRVNIRDEYFTFGVF